MRLFMRRRSMLFSAVVLFAAACGGSDSSVTGTNNNNGGTQSTPMSASIDGKAWNGAGVSVSYKNTLLVIAGFELASGTAVSVTSGVTGPGTYSLNFNNTNTG